MIVPVEEKMKRLERIRVTSAWAGLAFLFILGIGSVVLCFRTAATPDDISLNLGILIVSLLLGWLAGTLMSPGGLREQGQFSIATKAISTFASGYLLAKTDNLMNALLTPKMLLESSNVLPGFRVIVALAGFVGMFLHIYIMRVYILRWVPEAEDMGRQGGRAQAPLDSDDRG